MSGLKTSELVTRFETGDKPTGTDFSDLIESFVNKVDTTTQSMSGGLEIAGPISAATVSAAVGKFTRLEADIVGNQAVPDISSLRSVSDLTDNAVTVVFGYSSATDGMGGTYCFDASSSASDDYVTVISPDSGTGRWIRTRKNDALFFSTVSGMTAVGGILDGQAAIVHGYASYGDGGGGQFYYDADASASADAGTIIQPDSGTGRWKRVIPSGELSLSWFNVFSNTTADQTTEIQGALDRATELNCRLYVPAGTYRVKNLLVSSNTNIVGSGPATLLKLTDDGETWDHVITTASAGATVNSVSISNMTIDGNSITIGEADDTMHGIAAWGVLSGWKIADVNVQNTRGCGISLTSNVTAVPQDIFINNVIAENCYRQDFGLVKFSGLTVSNCVGDGTFDVECNDPSDTAENLTATNLRFDRVNITLRGASEGEIYNTRSAVSNIVSENDLMIRGASNSVFSNITTNGIFQVSECYRCVFDNINAAHLRCLAPTSSYTTRECQFSNIFITCEAGEEYGLSLTHHKDLCFSGVVIDATGSSEAAVYISQASDPGENTTVFEWLNVKNYVTYGIRIVNGSALENTTLVFKDSVINGPNTGNKAITYDSGSSTCNGNVRINNSRMTGDVYLAKAKEVEINGLVIYGDSDLACRSGTGDRKIFVNDVTFIRVTAGDSPIRVDSNTSVAAMYLTNIRQYPSGEITVDASGTTYLLGVEPYLHGLVVESSSWASSEVKGLTSVQAGSLYYIRGNATNWAYTHNGSSWVAKAH